MLDPEEEAMTKLSAFISEIELFAAERGRMVCFEPEFAKNAWETATAKGLTVDQFLTAVRKTAHAEILKLCATQPDRATSKNTH